MIDVHPFDRARKQFYGHGASAIELAHGWRGAVFLVTRSLTISSHLVSWLFSGPSPWVPDSCAGFLTQTIGWRLSSWLTVAVFTSPSDSSPWGPITLRVPDSCAGFRTHLRGSRLKPLVGDSRRDSPLQFSPPLVIPLLEAPSLLGFLTHVRGSRLICGVPDSNLWLATLVVTHRCSFHPPSDSSPSGPITLRVPDSCAGFRTHLRGSRLKPLVGDSRRDSPLQFSPPLVIPLLEAPSPLGFLTHVRGSGLICGVPDSNLWLATLVVTHRCSFHLP